MPKHKIEALAQAPADLQDQPMAKRRRVPHLNFSIESMMQPASQQAASPSGQAKHQVGSRSPSPACLSEAGSASSGSTGTLGGETLRFPSRNSSLPNHQQHNQHQMAANDNESLSSSSSSSSRISSPISPGWNASHELSSPTLQSHSNHHNHHQHNHRASASNGIHSSNNHHRPHASHLLAMGGASSSSATAAQQQHGGGSSGAQQHRNASTASTAAGSCAPNSRLNQVECVLDNKDMWDKFNSLNTEMIITKTGRRMFPVLKVQFHNLDPNARYAVSMDIVPVDNKRYRYAYHKSCWQVAGKADPSAEPRLYPHPDSPFNGDLLSRQVISFEKVKLTNNEMDKSGHIILNSMHKYQPRVHLIELKSTLMPASTNPNSAPNLPQISMGGGAKLSGNSRIQQQQQFQQQQQQQRQAQPQLDIEGYRTFVFSETVFTAVTAYQNQLITKMKIDKNPFAKGFRDSSRLSDMDRNDPFDYMSSLGPAAAAAVSAACAAGRFPGGPGSGPGGGPPLPHGSLEAAAAAAAAAAASGLPPGHPQGQMDQAYAQLLASAATAQSPWYQPGAPATSGPSPFGPASMSAAAACSTAQAAQHFQTQLWLAAAFSACLNNGGAGPTGPQVNPPTPLIHGPTPPPGSMQIHSNISSPLSTDLNNTATSHQRGESRSSG